MLGTNKITYVYNNYIIIYLPSTHSIESNNNYIHQPKSTNIVITMPDILGKWSHIDQFCNSDQILLLATDLLNSSDQKFFNKFFYKFFQK